MLGIKALKGNTLTGCFVVSTLPRLYVCLCVACKHMLVRIRQPTDLCFGPAEAFEGLLLSCFILPLCTTLLLPLGALLAELPCCVAGKAAGVARVLHARPDWLAEAVRCLRACLGCCLEHLLELP